ncbi:uncharacterized protein [Halyomorpha halys]|uniref:uncharacterized protein n=1 Tax=Halyomorpha halys TaxID=286706 RepID=UPI0034D1B9F8
MASIYTNGEYAAMGFVYGFCNGNANAACREYSSRHICSLHNVRVFRGANVDSDHFLSIAYVYARIALEKTNTPGQKPNRYNIRKLKDPIVRDRYESELDRCIQEVDAVEKDIDSIWDKYSDAISDTATKVLGSPEKDLRSPWFEEECEKATNTKNEAYQAMIQREMRRNVEMYRQKLRMEKHPHQYKKTQWEKRELEKTELLRAHKQ